MQEEKVYTLETLPKTINESQFYCFSSNTGNIFIGSIIGKSAMTSYYIFEVNGRFHRINETNIFSKDIRIIYLPNTKLACFQTYDDFIKQYNIYLGEIEKKKKKSRNRTVRYAVDTSNFECKKTTAEKPFYYTKFFDTKEDAINYANKGLKRMAKKITKFIETFNKQKEILKGLANKNYSYLDYNNSSRLEDYLKEIMKTPRNSEVGDILTKIDNKRYKSFSVRIINEIYSAMVTGFIGPDIATLNDGTLLIHSECNSFSTPLFIKQEKASATMLMLKRAEINKIIRIIDSRIVSLAQALKYANEYKPFGKNNPTYFYYKEQYNNELTESVEAFIKDNS